MPSKRLNLAVLAAVAAFMVVTPAASAALNTPKAAAKSSVALVTAYEQCTAPNIVDGPNSYCGATPRSTTVKFGPKSIGSFSSSALGPGKTITNPTGTDFISPARQANATGDIYYTTKITDLRDAGNAPFVGDLGTTGIGAPNFLTSLIDDNCVGNVECVTPARGHIMQKNVNATSQACAVSGTASKCFLPTTLNTMAETEDTPAYFFNFSYINGTATNRFIEAGHTTTIESSSETCLGDIPTGTSVIGSGTTPFACQGLLVGSSAGVPVTPGFAKPAKATKMQVALVRAYDPQSPSCGSSVDHNPAFNPISSCTIPASPVPPLPPVYYATHSPLKWAPNAGTGSIKLLRGKTGSFRDVKVIGKLTGVRTSADLKYGGPVSVRYVARVTIGNCTGFNLVCTREDEPISVGGTCTNGTCKISGPSNLQLPSSGQSNVEIGKEPTIESTEGLCIYDGAANDPLAKPFACTGSYIP